MLDPAATFFNKQTEITVTTKWDEIKEELQQRMELEEKKYPMTEKEKIMYDTLCSILSTASLCTLNRIRK